MEQTVTRIGDRAVRFPNARVDNATCAPGRAAILTGQSRANHGVGPGNTSSDYYDFYRSGRKATRPLTGTPTQWMGPWERDLALKAGLATTPVAASSQPLGGIASQMRTSDTARGDTTDDLQAFTGALPTWLANAGITCGFVGKYQNGYADEGYSTFLTAAQTYLYVPPGWQHWCAVTGDATATHNGGTQDHYHLRTCEYAGANSASGDGVTGAEQYYDYDVPISSASWSGGTATITTSQAHGLAVGDEVSVEGVNVAGYNTATGTRGHTVTGVPSSTQFQVAIASTLGAGTGGNAYPRKAYSNQVFAQRCLDFLSARTATEPWFLMFCPQMPHGANSDSVEVERRYIGTVDPAAFADWDGTDGNVSPVTIAGNATTARKQEWEQRQEMLASMDDAVGQILDYCESRGWHNVIVIFTSDNGYQNGEQEAYEGTSVWDAEGAKGYVWEGSVRLPLWIRHPRWAKGVDHPLICSISDIPLTVLDFFSQKYPSLGTHHAHTKRDGYSIARLLANPADPVASRAWLVTGTYKGASGDGLVDGQLRKYVRARANHSDRRLFDLTTDYETTDLAPSQGTVANAMDARLDALIAGRWNLTTNTMRTA